MNERLKILIVDDIRANLVALQEILSDIDVDLLVAESGAAALELLLNEQYPPALILLDVQMPVMNGFELMALIRKRPQTSHVPIIFLTAVLTDLDHIYQGYGDGNGAVDFIIKPFSSKVLRAKIKVFIDLELYRREKIRQSEQLARLTLVDEQLDVVLSSITDGVAILNAERRIERVNAALLEFTGVKVIDLVGLPVQQLFDSQQYSDEVTGYFDKSITEAFAQKPILPITNEDLQTKIHDAFLAIHRRTRWLVDNAPDHLVHLLTDAPMAILSVDSKFSITYCNTKAKQLLGVTLGAILPSSIHAYFKEGQVDLETDATIQAIKTNVTYVCADGVERTIEIAYSSFYRDRVFIYILESDQCLVMPRNDSAFWTFFRDDGGEAHLHLLNTVSLTESEAHCQQSEGYWLGVFEQNLQPLIAANPSKALTVLMAAPIAILVVNDLGVMVHVNDIVSKISGFSHDALTGKSVNTLIPERFHEQHQHTMQAFIDDSETKRMAEGRIVFLRCAESIELPISVNLIPVILPAGKMTLVLLRDKACLPWSVVANTVFGEYFLSLNSEGQKSAQEHLLKNVLSRERIVLVSVSEPLKGAKSERIMMIFKDITQLAEQQKILEQERLFIEQLYLVMQDGLVVTDVLGRIVKVNPMLSSITLLAAAEVIGKAFVDVFGATACTAESIKYMRCDGVARTLVCSESVLNNRVGESIGRVITVKDISELSAIKQRETLQKQMAHANLMAGLGQLAAGITHDFNNILAAIFGHAELLSLKIDSADPMSRNIQAIIGATERGSDVIRKLGNLGQESSGVLAPISLLTLIDSIHGLLKASLGKINFVISAEHSTEPYDVLGDETELQQVIVNLCMNAAHALKNIEYATITIKLSKQAEHIILAIEDNGCGIPEDVLPHVFEPFFTTKAPGEGSGLGLAMVSSIIKNIGGSIVCRSTVGVGTNFNVTFKAISDTHDSA
jgi:PAS domain S-box-containing protein